MRAAAVLAGRHGPELRRVTEHVWQVRIRRVLQVHVWLIAEAGGLTLVDTGFPLMARDVLRAVELCGAGPLQRIMLTHGHPDHSGGAWRIAREHDVPVYAHRLELPFLEGTRTYPRIARLLQPAWPGLVRALPEDDSGNLLPFGGLTPWLTPGHSPGHVAYHHEQDDVLLAGDLFKARDGRLRRLGQLFSLDAVTAVQSERILTRLKPARLEASHGGSVLRPAEQLLAWPDYGGQAGSGGSGHGKTLP
jgi:glyoxylase-like metal-dependent hydrolase (beta-lactamase superfamily II)